MRNVLHLIVKSKILCVMLLILSLSLLAQKSSANTLPANSKVFIAPMENSLESFIQAEIFKQKVPVQIVTDEKQADYVMSGSMVQKGGSEKWYNYLTGTAGMADSAQGSIKIIDKRSKGVVWAANAGDRSTFFGMAKKKGERKLAQRLVKQLKKSVD